MSSPSLNSITGFIHNNIENETFSLPKSNEEKTAIDNFTNFVSRKSFEEETTPGENNRQPEKRAGTPVQLMYVLSGDPVERLNEEHRAQSFFNIFRTPGSLPDSYKMFGTGSSEHTRTCSTLSNSQKDIETCRVENFIGDDSNDIASKPYGFWSATQDTKYTPPSVTIGNRRKSTNFDVQTSLEGINKYLENHTSSPPKSIHKQATSDPLIYRYLRNDFHKSTQKKQCLENSVNVYQPDERPATPLKILFEEQSRNQSLINHSRGYKSLPENYKLVETKLYERNCNSYINSSNAIGTSKVSKDNASNNFKAVSDKNLCAGSEREYWSFLEEMDKTRDRRPSITSLESCKSRVVNQSYDSVSDRHSINEGSDNKSRKDYGSSLHSGTFFCVTMFQDGQSSLGTLV